MEKMIKGGISDLHKKMLIDVFRDFVRICEKYDLQYFCCGGTAIGVIRHQGMIPWDDDIDILMPRPDYDKFLKIFNSLDISDNYELITAESNNRYYLPFAKMCDKRTTILEYDDIPCVFGVFIDVFPLDGAPANLSQRNKQLLGFRRAANKLLVLPKSITINVRSGLTRIFNLQIRTAYNEFRYALNKKRNREKVLAEIDGYMLETDYSSSSYCGNYGGMWGIKEFGPKEWFDGYELGNFEGISVRLPRGYHELLTQMYGDYMQLPPLDKRVSHHHVAYLNLEKRVEIDKVLKLIRK